MALTNLISPSGTAPAYEKDALLYRWIEAFSVNGSSDDGGDLELDVGSTAVAEIDNGDYVYVEALDGADNVETPVLLVKSQTSTTITLDFPFQSITTGTIRLMRELEFQIQTGYSGNTDQPLRTSLTVQITPDPKGFYELDVSKAVVTRFNFGPPDTSSNVAHNTQHRVIEPGGSPSGFKTALKQNEGSDIQEPTINYLGRQNIITELDASKYETFYSDPLEESFNPGAYSRSYLSGGVVIYTLNQTLQDGLTTTGPSPFPAGVSLITSDGGQTIEGLRVDLSIYSGGGVELVEDDFGTITIYEFTFNISPSLETREACEEGTMIAWWAPGGGWKQYQFNLLEEYELQDNTARVVQQNGERYVAAYEDQYKALSLNSPPEGLTVLRYLNTLFQSTEVFRVNYDSNGDIESYDRLYLEGGDRGLESIYPYRPNSNRFQITAIISEEIRALNQD